MTISARFPGTCNTCHQAIAVGDIINWDRSIRGASHKTCPVIVVALPTMVAPVPVSRGTVAGDSIVAFFDKAKKSGLKFPKLRFLAPKGGELRLSLAGPTSKYPGAIQVKVNDTWIGRINVDGSVVGSQVDADILATLTGIAVNPAAAAKAYGALMGRCSFCNLQLTDDGSVEVGYGPICARHYGLPHKAKGTKAVAVVGAVEPVRTYGLDDKGFAPAKDEVEVAAVVAPGKKFKTILDEPSVAA